MKKPLVIVIVLLVVALAAIPAVALGAAVRQAVSRPEARLTAVSESNSTRTATQPAVNRQSAAERPDSSRLPLLQELRADRARLNGEFRQNRLRIRQLSLENRSLRLELRERIKDRSRESLEPLKANRLAIQKLVDQLASTRGECRSIFESFQEHARQGNRDAMREDGDAILACQASRISMLQQINDLLEASLKLVP